MPDNTIHITLPAGYQPVTEEDIRKSKNYVLRRERVAAALDARIEDLLIEAADEIVPIALSYHIPAEQFEISYDTNADMFREIADIMDVTESDILDTVIEYSTLCTKEEERREALMAWIALLGRNGRDLQQTLHTRLAVFLRDIEAMIVACKLSKLTEAQTIAHIKSHLTAVYSSKEMQRAFAAAARTRSPYIRSMGVKHGNRGSSSSEAVNILRFGRTTLQMTWMRNLFMDYVADGVAGYYVLRGSNFPCALCDSYVGFHTIEDTDSFPPFHSHCCCYPVPVYLQQLI